MTGKHRVIIQNKRIRYDFEIKRNITVIRGDSATGKTALVDMVREHFENGNGDVLVIADGAAFGSEIEKLMHFMKDHENISLYLPESFEWLLLKSGLIHDSDISEMLKHPEDRIESRNYFSWERYFTARLIQLTQNTYLQYTKKQLNPAYLQGKVSSKILAMMKGIEL